MHLHSPRDPHIIVEGHVLEFFLARLDECMVDLCFSLKVVILPITNNFLTIFILNLSRAMPHIMFSFSTEYSSFKFRYHTQTVLFSILELTFVEGPVLVGKLALAMRLSGLVLVTNVVGFFLVGLEEEDALAEAVLVGSVVGTGLGDMLILTLNVTWALGSPRGSQVFLGHL